MAAFIMNLLLTARRGPTANAFPILMSHRISSPTRRTIMNVATTTNFVDSPAPSYETKFQSCGSTIAMPDYSSNDLPLDVEDSQRSSPPSLETWRRRLITKEDKFHIHKITGIGFMIASTVIMLGGIATKFSSIPSWLNSATLTLVWSGWLQLYTSLTMTRQFRSRRDEKAAFLVTAIGSSLTNFLALWFSPFCPNFFIRHSSVAHIIVALNTVCLWLPMLSFISHPKDTILNRQERIQSTSSFSFQQLRDTFAYFVQIPIINLAASRMVFQLHAQGRDFFLTSWVLPGTPVKNMAAIFYSMVFLSMASNYVALTATLRDKHLISQQTESGIMAVLGAVSIFLLTRAMMLRY